MSRRDLIASAERLNISTTIRANGKARAKSNEELRIALINATRGQGFSWQFKSATEADATCVRMVNASAGDYGKGIAMSQYFLRAGCSHLQEYKRLAGMKRRDTKKEAERLKEAKWFLDAAEVAMNLNDMERELL